MIAIAAPHLSREFYRFTKVLAECRSKEEEERLVLAEIASLKQLFLKKDVDKDQMKEYLVRAIYVEMLGFEAPFAHIHAINMAQEKQILCKMAGYLACRQLLKPQSDLMLLLINTIQKDLNSPNYMEVTCALQCICDLVNKEMLPIILPRVIECLDSENEYIRKHSIMAIRKFHEFDNECVPNLTRIIERGICDNDPSVMGCTLALLQDALAVKPRSYRNLVPSLVSILNQIVEKRLAQTYNYHKVPAPWIQISIISIFGKMGRGSKAPCDQICECLRNVLQQVDSTPTSSSLVASAIVSECVKTIAVISANESITKMCSISISRMLTSDNNNMRYAGVAGLTTMVGINASYAAENQLAVVACLEDRDETIRHTTLDLLYRMTNAKNVMTIVKCFIEQLKSKSEQQRSLELINKVSLLCEKFAPNAMWYLDTVIQIMLLAPNLLKDDALLNAISVLKENMEDESFQNDVTHKVDELMSDIDVLPDILVKVISWVYANYPMQGSNDATKHVNILARFLRIPRLKNSTIYWILNNMRILIIADDYNVPEDVQSAISHLENSNCNSVSQCCKEIRMLLQIKPRLCSKSEAAVLDMAFIKEYAQQRLAQGDKPYDAPAAPPVEELEEELPMATSELRYEPYKVETAAMQTYRETLTAADILTEEIIVNDVPKSWGPSGYIGSNMSGETVDAAAEAAGNHAAAEPSLDMTILSRVQRSEKVEEADEYVWKRKNQPVANKEQVEMARALFEGLTVTEGANDGGD